MQRQFAMWFMAAAAVLLVESWGAAGARATPIASGLELWLDANDPGTFTFASGNQVAQWADKSPGGNNASTGSNYPTLQPAVIGGLPAVSFNREPLTISGGLNVAANQDRTAFIVMDYGVQTNNNEVFGTSTGNMVDVGNWNRPQRLRLRQTDNAFSAANSLPLGSHVVAIQGSGAGSQAWSDGAQIINTTNQRFHWGMDPGMQVGGAGFSGREYVGNLAEVLLFDRALSDAELNAVGFYLEEKYGLDTAYTEPLAVIPEPSALLVWSMLAGLGIGMGRRRRKGGAK